MASSMATTRRWFHPNLTGKQSEEILLQQGKDGSFLVRPSQANPGDFTLSVRRGSSIIHVRIQNTEEYYDLYGGEKFATLAELIEYYTENQDTLHEMNGKVINLKMPLFTEEVTIERWYHGGISGKEAEMMLQGKGYVGSWLVRTSFHSPGDFVLSVRVEENKILQIKITLKDGKYDIGGGPEFPNLEALIDHYRHNPIIDTSGTVVRLKSPINATKIILKTLRDRIEDLSKQGDVAFGKAGFWEEFEQLQQQECKNLYSRKDGAKQENRAKNRFKNILPFDNTRVRLTDTDGGDYINANYLRMTMDEDPHYIATQGALPGTVVDFWRMVYQENVRVIVMTTNETERGRVKCHCYWPPERGEVTHGKLIIQNLMEQQFGFYILREFLVHRIPGEDEKPEQPRVVYHFHFVAWPDHGVPQDTHQVLTYLHDVNKKLKELRKAGANPGPIVVHCSAGIGRTGTFIVIDILLQKINKEGLDSEIDIQRSILHIRKQRSGMVQTEAQYKFIYMAVHDHIELTKQISKTKSVKAVPLGPESKKTPQDQPGQAYANINYGKENGNGVIPPPLPSRKKV